MSGRVLIIDGVATNRILMNARLAEACYVPLLAADADTALRLARQAAPDAILIDLDLHDPASGGVAGLALLWQLRTERQLGRTPVVAMAGAADAAARLAALRAGADEVLAKPVDLPVLLARLRNLMRRRAALADLGDAAAQAFGFAEGSDPFLAACDTTPLARRAVEGMGGRIALVTASPDTGDRLRRALDGLVPAEFVPLDRASALSDDTPWRPDIFVIEDGLGDGGGGLQLMSDLRSRGDARHAAYVLLRAGGGRGSPDATAFDMGVHDIVDWTCDPQELALRLNAALRRKRSADRMRASLRDGLRLAIMDDLTGLHNRRYALHHLAGMAEAARMEGTGLTVMVIDLDRFKTVNDRWGHATGDAVLVEVSRRLAQSIRMGDLLARIGGEEFLVALPEADATVARQVAERLCAAVQEQPIVLPDGASLRMTASIGLATCDGALLHSPRGVTQAIERADQALMTAKADGRNRVTMRLDAA